MPLTSLTKILNVFFQGALALVLLVYSFGFSLAPKGVDLLVPSGKEGAGPVAIALGLATVLCLLLGTAVDRVGERFLLPWIERCAETDQGQWFFRLTRGTAQCEVFGKLRGRVLEMLEESDWRVFDIRGSDGFPTRRTFRTAVEAIVFSTAKKEVLDWVVEHYALCRLATGFALLQLLAVPLLVRVGIDSIKDHSLLVALLPIIWCFILYGLLMTVVDQCLYSYTAMLGEILVNKDRVPRNNKSVAAAS